MDSIIFMTAHVILIGILFAGLLLMHFKKMAAIFAYFQSHRMNPFSIELLNNIVKGYRKLWSSSSTLGGILSWPSDLVGLSVIRLPKTAVAMTTSGKHTPSELFAQFSAGILSNVSF